MRTRHWMHPPRGLPTLLLAWVVLLPGWALPALGQGHSASHHADASSTATSPYAGQEARAIKALSEEEVQGLREGKGLGFALSAELNGHPGPRHVLGLAAELALDATQQAAMQRLFDAMNAEARRLGAALLQAEEALERFFAGGAATAGDAPQALRGHVLEAARLRGELRLVHLTAHLGTLGILTPHQVMRYNELRGYAGGGHMDHGGHGGGHGKH